MTADSVTLTWPAVEGATSYRVETADPAGDGAVVVVDSTSENLAVVCGLESGTPCELAVRAAANGVWQETGCSVEVCPLSAPSKVVASGLSSESVHTSMFLFLFFFDCSIGSC